MKYVLPRLLLLLLLSLGSLSAGAHQLGLALMQLQAQDAAGKSWQLRSETPASARAQAAAVYLQAPADCRIGHSTGQRVDGRFIRTSQFDCPDSWLGQSLRVAGLNPQLPDALVHVQLTDGQEQFHSLNRQDDHFVLHAQSRPPALAHYVSLGLHHIAGGLDHLLFVLLLCLCCQGRALIWTVSGFTLAHMCSLASVLIGGLHVSAMPVETLIALSLALLAAELLRRQRGLRTGLSLRYPMLMAFCFGLLHGLGFADALQTLGLPTDAQWRALLLFNLGIEVGQLLLIGLLLGSWHLLKRLAPQAPLTPLQIPLLYAIGVLAMFWSMQRVSLI